VSDSGQVGHGGRVSDWRVGGHRMRVNDSVVGRH
jgi:hypothetical protein